MLKSQNDKKISMFIKRKSGKLLLIVVFIAIMSSSAILYLNFINYLTFSSELKQPMGNIESVNTEKYLQQHPEISEMPNLDKIKYAAWKSDLTIIQVANSYKKDLLEERYDLKYENTIFFNGKVYYVLGFLKDLTAVGILISLDTNVFDNYKSEVIYASGNVFYFNEILNWYQSQYKIDFSSNIL